METVQTKYTGELRTLAKHTNSGTEIFTDAPLDNQGKGEFFSPTDLLATALGSCMFTIMGIAATTHKFSIEGATLKTTKIMGVEPRRVIEIILEFDFSNREYSEKEKKIIDYCTKNCPVGFSIHPEIRQKTILNF